MTPTDATNIIRLFVGECSVCGGEGTCGGEHEGATAWTCQHCNGAGATLKDATRENWPWWCWEDVTIYRDGTQEFSPERPYLPDLPTDDAAAVKVAERMRDSGHQAALLDAVGRWTSVGATLTLGAALLAALRGEG